MARAEVSTCSRFESCQLRPRSQRAGSVLGETERSGEKRREGEGGAGPQQQMPRVVRLATQDVLKDPERDPVGFPLMKVRDCFKPEQSHF